MGKFSIKVVFDFFLLVLLAFFSYLMLSITLQYLPIHLDVAFLRIKQQVVHIPIFQWAFFTHVFSSMFSLIAGYTQFSVFIKNKYASIHKIMGYIYFVTILIFSAPAGLVMAYYANGGFSSQLAFALLAIFWWASTFWAFIKVLNKEYKKHEYFIYLSYALTLSAITLRVWKYTLVYFFEPNPMDLYRLVAWLGWIPNLIFAFILLKFKNKIYEKH